MLRTLTKNPQTSETLWKGPVCALLVLALASLAAGATLLQYRRIKCSWVSRWRVEMPQESEDLKFEDEIQFVVIYAAGQLGPIRARWAVTEESGPKLAAEAKRLLSEGDAYLYFGKPHLAEQAYRASLKLPLIRRGDGAEAQPLAARGLLRALCEQQDFNVAIAALPVYFHKNRSGCGNCDEGTVDQLHVWRTVWGVASLPEPRRERRLSEIAAGRFPSQKSRFVGDSSCWQAAAAATEARLILGERLMRTDENARAVKLLRQVAQTGDDQVVKLATMHLRTGNVATR